MAGQTGNYVARDGSNNGTTPKGARYAQSGFIPWKGPNDVDVMEGVFADSMTPVVVGKANMSYDVRAFVGTNRQSAAIGPVVYSNDAVVNVTTTAAPGSNSRYDVIWCRQHLVAADGGSDTDVPLEFGVYQGAVAASPSIPDVKAAVHAGCLPLAAVLVTALAPNTSGLTFTRLHDWVARPGGGIYLDYTPTLGGGITTKTGRVNRYEQNNKKVSGYFDVVMNAAGSGTWTMTAPVTPVAPSHDRVVGNWTYNPASGTTAFGVILIAAGDTKFSFMDSTGALFTGAATNNDEFSGNYDYEAA